MRRTTRRQPRRGRAGFTLVELTIVMVIIGLLIAFILTASYAGAEQARHRATQALIVKLDVGVADRIEALLSERVTPNGAHRYLASINPPGNAPGAAPLPWGMPSEERATVIARFDHMRMELPDVFFIDPAFRGGSQTLYPVNFAGLPYSPPGASGAPPAYRPYILPLGHAVFPRYDPPTPPTVPPSSITDPSTGEPITGPGAGTPDIAASVPNPGRGIFGASYVAAAALYKLMGYRAQGYDAADNDNDGLIDEFDEGVPATGRNGVDDDGNGLVDDKVENGIAVFVANHQHATARSEMLYALLVEGRGPLGSVFNRDDFAASEVGDTDNDGAPEFIDGWGRPLQFHRWPIYHPAFGLQKGAAAYDVYEARQQSPLDPGGQVIAPAWWADGAGAERQPSFKARLFMSHFTSLVDPNLNVANPPVVPSMAWDRAGYYRRRAFFSRFLITSAGPDGQFGIESLTDATILGQAANATSAQLIGFVGGPPNYGISIGENWANPYSPPDAPGAAEDDLDNQELQNKAGGVQ